MHDADLKELVQQYLADTKNLQLATVAQGQPWICTVYFAFDEHFRLYWTSDRSRRHSREILQDSKAAVTVVRDAQRKQALQMVGVATELADDKLEHVHRLYQERFGPKDYDLEKMKQHLPEERGYWMFTPTEIWLWDQVSFPDAPKKRFL